MRYNLNPALMLLPVVITTAVYISGCSDQTKSESAVVDEAITSRVPESDSIEAEPQVFDVIALVKNITPSGNYMVLEHEDIEGYMSAMTMPFEVRDASVIEGIQVGDSVKVKITIDATGIYVSEAGLISE